MQRLVHPLSACCAALVRYAELRRRLLPGLRRDANHARVPAPELRRRAAAALAASVPAALGVTRLLCSLPRACLAGMAQLQLEHRALSIHTANPHTGSILSQPIIPLMTFGIAGTPLVMYPLVPLGLTKVLLMRQTQQRKCTASRQPWRAGSGRRTGGAAGACR